MTRYLGQTAMAELPVPDQWVPVLLGLWHSRKIMAEGQGERLLTLCQSGNKERGEREREGGGETRKGLWTGYPFRVCYQEPASSSEVQPLSFCPSPTMSSNYESVSGLILNKVQALMIELPLNPALGSGLQHLSNGWEKLRIQTLCLKGKRISRLYKWIWILTTNSR